MKNLFMISLILGISLLSSCWEKCHEIVSDTNIRLIYIDSDSGDTLDLRQSSKAEFHILNSELDTATYYVGHDMIWLDHGYYNVTHDSLYDVTFYSYFHDNTDTIRVTFTTMPGRCTWTYNSPMAFVNGIEIDYSDHIVELYAD